MSTRSATIVRQTTYFGEESHTKELMRFYRHYDGYPEGHGLQMARAVVKADKSQASLESWLASVLHEFLEMEDALLIEFEPNGHEHGDLAYLYVLEGIVDRRWGRRKDGTLPVTISVYKPRWDESYEDTINGEPIFSGTAYEYFEKWGEELPI